MFSNAIEEDYFDADGNFVEYVEKNQVKDAWLDSITKPVDPELGTTVVVVKVMMKLALTRLKRNKKEKISAETKAVFDQLTEDAMALMMKNRENNVYDEEKEVLEWEAQGYESLAKARMGGGKSVLEELETNARSSNSIASISAVGGGDCVANDDAFDMFGDDDEPAVVANAAAPGLENNGGGVENDTCV
ncbi:hypothetical protein RchiOBHm_Chr7g0224681 [Rosa chinensis]|uniref:Uncharacterized protein n=1 Tax=Rosa chinensis TaxID=74649 RepID=A0A2P6PDW3_ROSCH|nr:hypothetical protein RchiOBHm_Chr7g0224681 [Rosa chinensis]